MTLTLMTLWVSRLITLAFSKTQSLGLLNTQNLLMIGSIEAFESPKKPSSDYSSGELGQKLILPNRTRPSHQASLPFPALGPTSLNAPSPIFLQVSFSRSLLLYTTSAPTRTNPTRKLSMGFSISGEHKKFSAVWNTPPFK